MSIQTTPQITDQDLERATAVADGLRALATVVEAIPSHADHFQFAFGNQLAFVGDDDDPRQVLADTARATLAAGGKVDKYYSGEYSGVVVSFGPVAIQIYAGRADVCERVVVGTEEVTKEVPDPEALASVPKVTVTETVEKVEWRCHPLLAEATDGEKAAA